MKAPWWLKAAALALLCCCCGGCAHSSEKQAEAREAVNATETAKASGSFAETKVEGPSEVDTWEFAPMEKKEEGTPVIPLSPYPALTMKPGTVGSVSEPAAPPENLPTHGPLIKFTAAHYGPVSTTIAARATEATREAVQATREVKTDQRSKWSALVPWWLWLVGLVALGGGAWLLRSRIRMLVGL